MDAVDEIIRKINPAKSKKYGAIANGVIAIEYNRILSFVFFVPAIIGSIGILALL
tara:strand:- start:51 stop:215 length:165 start_codon:yes stop_codon:yes gene_type:complete